MTTLTGIPVDVLFSVIGALLVLLGGLAWNSLKADQSRMQAQLDSLSSKADQREKLLLRIAYRLNIQTD